MCGICGIVGSADERLLRTMTDTLAHRGPDGDGLRTFAAANGHPPAALGHRRLTIIDPTPRGAQPMVYRNRYWITYNGELYNFRELRKGLERDGYEFASDCDTEVVLALYARDGEAMLDKLNGIYAFAIWDDVAHRLFLARDRLGVKPLYYAERDGALYFASEVKALLPALERPSLRHDAVADYLTFLWVPDPDTVFEGVYKLPPGHCATYADGRLTIRAYWDIPLAPETRPESEWIDTLGDTLGAAVRRQMVADVPLGSFLSGGVDSSAIVAEATAASTEKLTTYTIGFSQEDLSHEPIPDDLKYARIVADRFGVDYHERTLAADVVALLPKLVWHMDEPVADPACITTYLICSTASERLKVILSGMGADEVFAGYPRYLAARLAHAADIVPRRPRAAARSFVESRVGLGRPGRLRGPRRNLRKLVRGLDADPFERHLTYTSYYQPHELAELLAPDLRAELRGHDPFRRHRAYYERTRGQHWLNRLLYVDQKTYLPCLNLTYTDKMSMAASTEVRVPLLDDEVIALAGRIPPNLKLRRFTRKYVLKRSVEPLLPSEIVHRPKAGFGAPVRAWTTGALRPLLDDLLSPTRVAARGLFEPAAVQRLLDDNRAGRSDNALRIWALLTLELWQQIFVDGVRP
jgi:asparagine synthase (glutamine-hydrolysing)